jgi:hypothetical protein
MKRSRQPIQNTLWATAHLSKVQRLPWHILARSGFSLVLAIGLFATMMAQNPASVEGESNSPSGRAVFGLNTSTTGSTAGVRGEVLSTNSGATGVFGLITSATGTGSGVKGQNNGTTGYGVWGTGGGNAIGVLGQTNSNTNPGVWAYNSGSGIGLKAESNGNLIEAWDYDPVNLRFKVDNAGNVTADGSYTSPAADFAELLPATKHAELEPGDVLAIGEDGKLVKSFESYQKSVAGVYSTKPAFMGGHDVDVTSIGKVPLAMVGIVPVKVSTQNGPIKPGDLLVASEIPGYAMKGRKKTPNGTAIGKALEPLNQDRGIIKMLVILQ